MGVYNYDLQLDWGTPMLILVMEEEVFVFNSDSVPFTKIACNKSFEGKVYWIVTSRDRSPLFQALVFWQCVHSKLEEYRSGCIAFNGRTLELFFGVGFCICGDGYHYTVAAIHVSRQKIQRVDRVHMYVIEEANEE